jgi:hypothetical protein
MSTGALQVEAILQRRVFSGKVLYLVHWKGLPLEQATWESVKVLKHYRQLIRHFNEQHRLDPQPSLSSLSSQTEQPANSELNAPLGPAKRSQRSSRSASKKPPLSCPEKG